MSSNGNLPASALAPIGNGYYMERNAAAAFNAMCVAARKRWGRSISVRSAYRTYSQQVYFWNLYRSGRGNLAAYPGTSNHGWGLAIDCYSQWDRWAIDQIGSPFGFSKRTSDAPSEWWHIKWNGSWHGTAPPSGPRVLKLGMSGTDVEEVQIYLVRGGYLHKADRTHPKAIDGSFGPGTKAGVQHFQRDNHMTADGVVGPATIAALRRKYK